MPVRRLHGSAPHQPDRHRLRRGPSLTCSTGFRKSARCLPRPLATPSTCPTTATSPWSSACRPTTLAFARRELQGTGVPSPPDRASPSSASAGTRVRSQPRRWSHGKGGASSGGPRWSARTRACTCGPDIWVPFTGRRHQASHCVNRGDYPAPLDVLLGVTSVAAGSKVEIDVGGSNMTITLGALTNAGRALLGRTEGADPPDWWCQDRHACAWTCSASATHDPSQGPARQQRLQHPRGTGPSTLSAGTRLMYSESFA